MKCRDLSPRQIATLAGRHYKPIWTMVASTVLVAIGTYCSTCDFRFMPWRSRSTAPATASDRWREAPCPFLALRSRPLSSANRASRASDPHVHGAFAISRRDRPAGGRRGWTLALLSEFLRETDARARWHAGLSAWSRCHYAAARFLDCMITLFAGAGRKSS